MHIRSIAIAGHIIGILFKTLHWPGANILLLASSVLLIGTLVILLIRKPGPWSVQMRLPGMLVGSLIAVLTGGMFKVMHWPGANMLLMLGLVVCAAWFLIAPLRSQPAVQ